MNKDGFDSTAREKASAAVAREAAAQGIVLLKNENNVLPIMPEKQGQKVNIALFGLGQIYTIKGGTGSGNVYNQNTVNILDGFKNNELLNVDEELSEKYSNWALTHPTIAVEAFLKPNAFSNPEMPLEEEFVKALSKRNEVAVVVISRISGEGADRKLETGDYYLSDGEQDMIDKVTAHFNKVVLVLNVADVICTKFINDKIDSVLYVSLPGQEGGNAVADVLTGKVVPSGKLTDTWAIDYADYSTSKNFSNPNKNGNIIKVHNKNVEQCDIDYEEGIYVGYRYFDTFGKEVAYPFGFGLSYADLKIDDVKVEADNEKITVYAKVSNLSDKYYGKEVVQVYCSAPDGKLEKPYQQLIGFAKTDEIAPGENANVKIEIELSSLASYDESWAAYILEQGYYYVRVGNSSRNTTVKSVIYIDETCEVEVLKNCFKQTELELLSKNGQMAITYSSEEEEVRKAKMDVITICAKDIQIKYADYSKAPEDPKLNVPDNNEWMFEDVLKNRCTMEQFVARLSVKEMATIVCGTRDMPDLDALEREEKTPFVFEELEPCLVSGAAGQSTGSCLDAYGIPQIVLADGPAGVRINQEVLGDDGKVLYNQNCTAFPVGTMLASSWDTSMIKKVGEAIGTEMKEYGIDLWLAPGMNIHRNPLCGRNFEYYSEDPVVAGTVAAAITEGVQSKGVGVTIKHFAANNQEEDRMSSNSVVSERTLREIYLKGFEIAIKKARPWSIMTSYNDINGVPSADNFELCTAVARAEWGFDGFIMTDWGGGQSSPALSMYAGNDMIQPGGKKPNKAIVEAVESGQPILSNGLAKVEKVVTTAMLQRSVCNILNVIKRCKG